MAYGESTNSKKKKKKNPPSKKNKNPPNLAEGGVQDMLKIGPWDPRPIA